MEAFGKRHRCPWFCVFATGTVISRDQTRVLTGNVEIAIGIKRYVKGMIDAGIHLSVALYEDCGKGVLPIFIERAFELQHLAVFEIRVDHIQVLIWPKHESAKLTKLNSLRKTLFVQSLPQFLPTSRIDVNIVSRGFLFAAMKADVPFAWHNYLLTWPPCASSRRHSNSVKFAAIVFRVNRFFH